MRRRGLKFEKSDELSSGVFEESGGTGGGGDKGVEEVVDNGRKRKRANGGVDIGNGGADIGNCSHFNLIEFFSTFFGVFFYNYLKKKMYKS